VNRLLPAAVALALVSACHAGHHPLIDAVLIDSLSLHASPSLIAVANQQELSFWRSRVHPYSPGFLNETKYAGCLAMSFRLGASIDSLKKADSILQQIGRHFNHHEASAELTMAGHCITEHRFAEADSFFQQACRIGLRPYEALLSAFDVDVELGRYAAAKIDLNGFASNDYAYYFRKAKMDHLEGELDSSISDMRRAACLAHGNGWLEDAAMANEGDLCLHAGDLSRARDAYIRCVTLNSGDYHSWLGLGWIALVHDGNSTLAERIFHYAQSKTSLPDPLFRLTQAAAARQDSTLEMETACDFVRMASAPVYGRMYNKYLIQLYTGILADPGRAERIARDELTNRATPQTYAWYAWALLANHKRDKAYAIYRRYVSGQPLEALELYWMGRLMESLQKNYDARSFYTAASKTPYDLDPADATYALRRSGD
jgi:tetratricopeptide (TPR) repeat protein